MHPYIPHLLADIAAAHRPETDVLRETTSWQTFEEEMEEIERWIAGEKAPNTFGHWCGLEASGFPPSEQLSIEDMITVCKAFDRMMYSWNLSIDLPEKFPGHLKYSFRVNTLNEKTAILSCGMMSFDYCTGHAPDCIFKEYCPCLKIRNRSTENDPDDITDLPADELQENNPGMNKEDPDIDLPF